MKKILFPLLLFISIILTQTSVCYSEVDTSGVSSLIVYDKTYDSVILQKNPTTQIYPASISKVMTAILVLETVDDLGEKVIASEHAVSQNRAGGSTTGIQAGEELTYRNLLEALLIRSGNEVSYILAEAIAGNEEDFVAMMNQKSILIGLTNTQFINPCGLHEEDHYSTAYDLLKLAKYAMKNPVFAQIVSIKFLSLPTTNIHTEKGWADDINTNLLMTDTKYFSKRFKPTGIKTGSTPFAGYCLMSSVVLPAGNELYGIVLGSPDEASLYEFNKNMYEEISTYYNEKTLFDTTEIFAYIDINNESIPLYSNEDIVALVPKNWPVSKLHINTIPIADAVLPIDEKTILGTIELRYEDKIISTYDLVSHVSIDLIKDVPIIPTAESTEQIINETKNKEPVYMKSEPFVFDEIMSLILIISSSAILLLFVINNIKEHITKK